MSRCAVCKREALAGLEDDVWLAKTAASGCVLALKVFSSIGRDLLGGQDRKVCSVCRSLIEQVRETCEK